MSDSWDISSVTRSSSTSDWTNLTPANVEIIDQIVALIPSHAKMPDVLSVYSDVLRARGIDLDNDVVIFRLMLQLGRLKGSWRDKWESVKASLDHHTSSSLGVKTPPPAISDKHWNPRAESPTPRPHPRMRAVATGSSSAPAPHPNPTTATGRNPQPAISASEGQRQVVQDARKRLQQLLKPQSSEEAAPIPHSVKGKGRAVEPPASEPISLPASSRLDAWKIAQDEVAATVFRETALVEKCWHIWRAGFHWIRTTGDQVDAARQQVVAHRCLRYWHKSYLRQQGLMEKAAQVHDRGLLRRAMHSWIAHTQKKLYHKMRQQEWRMDMRRRMAAVQGARHQRLMGTAFVTWRLSHLNNVWERHQNYSIVHNAFARWRHAQMRIRHLESIAAQFTQARDNWMIEDLFFLWRRNRELQSARTRFEEWTGSRLVKRLLGVWRENWEVQKTADARRSRLLLSRSFSKWRLALAKAHMQEQRASRWAARRDKFLVHICARVWIARERGILLERVRDARTIRDCMLWWIARLRHKRAMEAHADAFARHIATPLVRGALSHWLAKTRNLQRSEVFGAEYHAARLTMNAFAKWDRALSARVEAQHQARQLHQQFLMRRFFKRWKDAVTKRKLKAAWRQMKRRHMSTCFQRWLHLARMHRVSRVLGERSLMRSALSHWIARVVEVKERELVTGERADKQLVTTTFDHWRGKYYKLQENISLLENFVLIRQQNELRNVFVQWYNSMQRRRYLVEAEEVMASSVALTTICTVWDKWREKFLEQRLEPLERQFELQMQANLRFLFFSRWYSKTLTLPAIHFRVMHLKGKAWDKWRAAMTPAPLMKKARELDRRSVLIRVFEKWQATYKETMARKARASQWRKLLPDSKSSLPATSPFGTRSSPSRPFPPFSTPISKYPSPVLRRPLPPPSPPPRPPMSTPIRPSLSDHILGAQPRRPRSMTVESTSSPAPALTPTVISRPRSGFGGISSSIAASSESDGKLWKQLRGERGLLRGARTDSRGGSPAPL